MGFRQSPEVDPKWVNYMDLDLDIFETPVTVTPQQEISKTPNSSNKKYLTFTFGRRTFTFGDSRGFRGFWNFFFGCWGVLGLRGSGGPVGVFENI